MKTTIAGHLLALLLLLGSVPGFAQQPAAEALAGTYSGEVFNGGDMDPVSITFTRVGSGRLVGEYIVDDEDGLLQGRVSNAIFEDSHTVMSEWTDKYGEGFVRLVFSQDYGRFDGFWGSYDSDAVNPWHGVRE